MITIVFIRHAKTDINGKGFISSRKDLSLNKKGIESCIQKKYNKGEFDKVYASPTKRAIETAELLYPYKKAEVNDLISQREYGALCEHLKKEYSDEFINSLKDFLIEPDSVETLEEITKRINGFLEFVRNNNEDNSKILVITHNGIMKVIKKIFLNTDTYEHTSNLCGFTIEISKN